MERMNEANVPRYSLAQRNLHWLMAGMVLLAYLLIEQRGLVPRGTAARTVVTQSHFWIGLSILALAAWRLLLRRRLAVPPVTPAPAGWQAALATTMHVLLYAFFLVMPLLGLATLWTGGRPLLLPFGVALHAPFAADPALHEALEHWHGTIGRAFYAVIAVHVLASLWHHAVRRDDTLRRML
jgi:cytochrome b561